MTVEQWNEEHGTDHDNGEPMISVVEKDTEFEDTLNYIESWSDKFFDFAEKNKGEPWLEVFLEKFREYANRPVKGGPVFEEWRKQ